MGNSACLGEKAIHVGACHLLMQDFYGRLSLKIDMLSEENVSEVPPTQQADKAIIPKLLSYTANHGPPPFGCPSSLYGFSISSGSSIIRETWISINLYESKYFTPSQPARAANDERVCASTQVSLSRQYLLCRSKHNIKGWCGKAICQRGCILIAPSNLIISPLSISFSIICFASAAYSSGRPSRDVNGTCCPSELRTPSDAP